MRGLVNWRSRCVIDSQGNYFRKLLHLLDVNFCPQIDKLKKEIEIQQKEKTALESRANEAERKAREFNSKLESVSSYFSSHF